MSNQSIMLSRFPEEAAHILEKKLQVIEKNFHYIHVLLIKY